MGWHVLHDHVQNAAVAWGDRRKPVSCGEANTSGHVLGGDAWLARNVTTHVARKEATALIVIATWGSGYNHRQRAPAIEFCDALRAS
jgi:hypothetical protein